MRLLGTKTLTLEDAQEDNIPKYAILSHTWEHEEVSYQEVLNPTAEVKRKLGYEKIRKAAAQARRDRFDYIWVDTCCINKESSAELSEAINSMFKWYRSAQVCYVFLADVEYVSGKKTNFEHSRWFTRGWTLQELIAPRNVHFFSKDWVQFATKRTITKNLYDITDISLEVLWTGDLNTASAAQKMCWASKRQTTRSEDLAYCLMGIFNVNMPLLYGEGQKSFIRLQEEIVKQSDDHSIFAWKDEKGSDSAYRGLFARSPKEFAQCRKCDNTLSLVEGFPYSLTNLGLSITLPLQPVDGQEGLFVARLNCVDQSNGNFVGIYLRSLSWNGSQFARVHTQAHGNSASWSTAVKTRTIFIRQAIRVPPSYVAPKIDGFLLDINNIHEPFSKMDVTTPPDSGRWDRRKHILRPASNARWTAAGALVQIHSMQDATAKLKSKFYVAVEYDAPRSMGRWSIVEMEPNKWQMESALKKGEAFNDGVRTHGWILKNKKTKISMRTMGYRLIEDRLMFKIRISIEI
jgi:hypothetical protein